MGEQLFLFCDFETKSRIDLKARGLDVYMRDPSTKALMLSYAMNHQLVPDMWFPGKEPLPDKLAPFLNNHSDVFLVAQNAEFERLGFEHLLGIYIPIRRWIDTKVLAQYASISPASLESICKVLNLPEDKSKAAIGKKLIKLFSVPNKEGDFNDETTHPVEWQQFCDYCKQDTVSEQTIFYKLFGAFQLPAFEKQVQRLTLEMNSRGVPIDPIFVERASKIVAHEQARLGAEMRELTGVENPNSPKQLLDYLQSQGYPYGSIGKDFVARAKKEISVTAAGKRCLELREFLAKSSTAKLEALRNFVGPDNYLRHTFQYYGAPRTGRWSARGPQLQNFPRPNGLKRYDEAVEAIRTGDAEIVRAFGSPMDVVSSCLRSALRAPEGSRFVVGDLSAIDSRTLAWLSNCKEILDVYKTGRDVYTTYGERFYNMSYDELRHDKERRGVNKVIFLSCGYQLGGGEEKKDDNGDIIRTGLWAQATKAGVEMTEDECHRAVGLFREMYPAIPAFWKALEGAFISAIRTGENQRVGKIVIGAVKPCRMAWALLPSGRRLHFIKPQLDTEQDRFGNDRLKITYEDVIIGTTRGRVKTYGGALTGIITQAVARDVFSHGMLQADKAGFHTGAIIHDEVVACESDARLDAALLEKCLTTLPAWADENLPLAAECFESVIYKKG